MGTEEKLQIQEILDVGAQVFIKELQTFWKGVSKVLPAILKSSTISLAGQGHIW